MDVMISLIFFSPVHLEVSVCLCFLRGQTCPLHTCYHALSVYLDILPNALLLFSLLGFYRFLTLSQKSKEGTLVLILSSDVGFLWFFCLQDVFGILLSFVYFFRGGGFLLQIS